METGEQKQSIQNTTDTTVSLPVAGKGNLLQQNHVKLFQTAFSQEENEICYNLQYRWDMDFYIYFFWTTLDPWAF